jgi:hypothetical protein
MLKGQAAREFRHGVFFGKIVIDMSQILADHGARYREVDCLAVPNPHYFDVLAPSGILSSAISPIDPLLDSKVETLKSTQRSMTHSYRSVIRKRDIACSGSKKKRLQVYRTWLDTCVDLDVLLHSIACIFAPSHSLAHSAAISAIGRWSFATWETALPATWTWIGAKIAPPP